MPGPEGNIVKMPNPFCKKNVDLGVALGKVIVLYPEVYSHVLAFLPDEAGDLVSAIRRRMEENCRRCAGAPPAEAIAAGATDAAPRRVRHLLRLVVARFSHRFAEARNQEDGWAGGPGRSFVEPFDVYLHMLFGPAVYRELDEVCATILAAHGVRRDGELWRALLANRMHRFFGLFVLFQMIRRFADYARARTRFLTIVDNNRGGRRVFSGRHFNVFFQDTFQPLFEVADREDSSAMLDCMFGDGAAALIAGVRASHLGAVQAERLVRRASARARSAPAAAGRGAVFDGGAQACEGGNG
jgi:hypothetical protein